MPQLKRRERHAPRVFRLPQWLNATMDRSSSNLPPAPPATAEPDPVPVQFMEMAQGICHRVKNDLQTIANLLTLAGPYAATPADLIQAVENRIGALSAGYTLFSQEAAVVTLKHLGQEIAQKVIRRLEMPLRLQNKFPSIKLSLRLCSIFSLWLHEMIANACLHGLVGSPEPALSLAGALNDQFFQLSVLDNGKGLPAGFDPRASGRLGLRLAFGLAEMDLKGKLELLPASPGLEARLVVPIREFNRLNQKTWK